MMRIFTAERVIRQHLRQTCLMRAGGCMYIGECQHSHHRVAPAARTQLKSGGKKQGRRAIRGGNLAVNYEVRLNKSGALAVAVGLR